MANYLKSATASSTYQTLADLSNYLKQATASTTYQTIADMANYSTIGTALSTYQRISNMINYLTISYSPFHCAGKISANGSLPCSNGKFTFTAVHSPVGTYTITFSTNYSRRLYVVNALATTPYFLSIGPTPPSTGFTGYTKIPQILQLLIWLFLHCRLLCSNIIF